MYHIIDINPFLYFCGIRLNLTLLKQAKDTECLNQKNDQKNPEMFNYT